MSSLRRVRNAGALWLAAVSMAWAQAPRLFHYQGRLANGTNLYNGTAHIVFRIYDTSNGPGIVWYQDSNNVGVADGLYSATIGDDTSYGDMSWTAAGGSFYVETEVNGIVLAPRERILSVVYAITAGGVTSGAINSMMLGNGVVLNANLADNAVDSAKISNGSVTFSDMNQSSATNGQIMKWNGSAWVAANDLTSGAGALASYSESGAFSPGPQAIGSDSIAQGRESYVEGDLAVAGGGGYNRIGYASHYAAIGGGLSNRIGSLSYQAAIGGGRENVIVMDAPGALIGGGSGNYLDMGTTNAFIGGGWHNAIGPGAHHSVIPGGYSNAIGAGTVYGTVGGGYDNRLGNSDWSTIAGGAGNRIEDGAQNAFIGGGIGHDIFSNASYAVIAGGQDNDVGTNADWAVIAGGRNNLAAKPYSWAGGRKAKALHEGTFVWADSQDADFQSGNSNAFLVRAGNGVGINLGDPEANLHVAGDTNAGRVAISPLGLVGGDAELILSEDENAEYGVVLRYDDVGNHLQIRGRTGGYLSDPSVTVARDQDWVGIATTNQNTNFALQVDGPAWLQRQVVIGDRYEPDAGDHANRLNVLVTSTAGAASNGITFRESSSVGMSFGYDGSGSGGKNALRIYNDDLAPLVAFEESGKVGIGVEEPMTRFHVQGGNWDLNATDGDVVLGNESNRFEIGIATNGAGAGRTHMRAQGQTRELCLGAGTNDVMTVYTNRVSVPILEITGGADLAEPFHVRSDGEVIPGAVLVIDDAHPGDLAVSARPYDRRVAGVVSGAGGLVPGISLVQQDAIRGNARVALTGRAYAWANVSNGPIRAGDLLTTSAEPGQAMRVTDAARSQGAILGKAMSSLESGSGLVLVLVNLQ